MARNDGEEFRGILKGEIGRRALLKSSMLAGGATLAGSVGGLLAGPVFGADRASKNEGPVVETSAGKLRGVVRSGIYAFRGVPYGASTAGNNRFMPPRKPESWTGVRDAFQNGYSSPQLDGPIVALTMNLTPRAPQAEDCLSLNIFTPRVNDNRKRPVMVWLHGGGFANGAGTAQAYDGTNLARSGDVMVVAVSHRLNVDIVAALEWVRDNISQFGGDPGSVTLFGQSGGANKIAMLLGMPPAKGLFHRAIMESGGLPLRGVTRDQAQKNTERILAALSLPAHQIDEIQKLPMERLLKALDASGVGPLMIGPVVDGRALPRHPFDPTAPEVSAGVPLIIGTANTEGTLQATPDLFNLDKAGLQRRLSQILGDSTDRIIDTFQKDRSNATPSELLFYIMAMRTHRNSATAVAERRAALGKAPTYMYQFTWETPVDGGKYRSPHTIELPFVFNNVWERAEEVGTGPELQPLADKVSGVWVAFARTGNPTAQGTPKWPAYNESERATMFISNEWKVVNDPFPEERLVMKDVPPPAGPETMPKFS